MWVRTHTDNNAFSRIAGGQFGRGGTKRNQSINHVPRCTDNGGSPP